MVVRKPAPKVQTPEQARRAAQRKLAREIKEGTYKPSAIGKKAREVVSERARLVKEIQDYKRRTWGDRPTFNNKRSDIAVEVNPITHEPRSVADLRMILDYIDSPDEGATEDIRSAFFYK